MLSISVTQKTTNRLAFPGGKMWTCKTRACQLVSHYVCVASISVVTPPIDELGKWCQFIRTGVGASDIFLNWWYVEKSSWRVIMSPNDRVSTTWWRQTRPARTNCYQNKNLGKCVTKNESKFKFWHIYVHLTRIINKYWQMCHQKETNKQILMLVFHLQCLLYFLLFRNLSCVELDWNVENWLLTPAPAGPGLVLVSTPGLSLIGTAPVSSWGTSQVCH